MTNRNRRLALRTDGDKGVVGGGNMETDNKKLMSISEVAKYLGISRYGVIQLIKTNVVKAVDIGKKKYIVASSLKGFMEESQRDI